MKRLVPLAVIAAAVGVAALVRVPQAPESSSARARRMIVFERTRSGKNMEIFIERVDGARGRYLTNNRGKDGQPALSPDGKRVAFGSDRFGVIRDNARTHDIFVVGVDGKGLVRLTRDPAEEIDPAWSPDGKRIMFRRYLGDNPEVFVMNADGTGVKRLTHDSATDIQATFAPDGKRFVFASDRTGNAEIYISNLDGTGLTRLTHSKKLDGQPELSPDGKRIVFMRGGGTGASGHFRGKGAPPGVSKNAKKPKAGGGEIYIMNADGTHVRNITNVSYDDAFPAWSPDGEQIAFQSDREAEKKDGNIEIYATDEDGTLPYNITQSKLIDGAPDW